MRAFGVLSFLGCCCCCCCCLCCVALAEDVWRAYRPVAVAVDAEASLRVIRDLPLKRFELAHDTKHGRVHHGVLPKDAEGLAALYLERVSRAEVVPGTKGGLTRPVVDERVLFYHGVAAVQALGRRVPDTVAKAGGVAEGVQSLAARVDAVEAAVLDDTAWRTAAEVAPVRELEEARTESGRFRVAKVEYKKLRRERVARATDVFAQTTRAVAHDLAVERQRFDDGRLGATLEHNANASDHSAIHLEAVRLETALLKQAGEFHVAAEHERVRAVTAVDVAVEVERQKAHADRLNEDVHLRLIAARGAEARERMLAAMAAVATQVAAGFEDLRKNPERLRRVTASVIAVISGFFFTREAANFARQVLARYLTRPNLIRESSRFSSSSNGAGVFFFFPRALVAALVAALRRLFARRRRRRKGRHGRATEEEEEEEEEGGTASPLTDGIILDEDLASRLEQLAASMRGARRLRAPLRHLLLHGPPGTGKTMVARRLAQVSGLDWAIMSGGDVGPLGPDAATELHKVMNWAKRSPRGVVLFVDEAEAALCDRSSFDGALSEEAVSALNAFLFHTSSPSHNLMLVLATNRPDSLDAAVLDRIDEIVRVPLPDLPLRRRLLDLYFHQSFPRDGDATAAAAVVVGPWWCRPPPPAIAVRLPDVPAALRLLASQTEGFSGRELAKLILSVQGAVHAQATNFLTPVLQLTPEIWDTAVKWKLSELKPRAANHHHGAASPTSPRRGGAASPDPPRA